MVGGNSEPSVLSLQLFALGLALRMLGVGSLLLGFSSFVNPLCNHADCRVTETEKVADFL